MYILLDGDGSIFFAEMVFMFVIDFFFLVLSLCCWCHPRVRLLGSDDGSDCRNTTALFTIWMVPLFPLITARQNEGDLIEWDSDSGGATLREDPPMPKIARRNKVWVGAQASLESPTCGRGAQEASFTTTTRPAQAPDGTRATETGPGREMLSTVEEPG